MLLMQEAYGSNIGLQAGYRNFFETNLKLSGRDRCSYLKIGQKPPSMCRKKKFLVGESSFFFILLFRFSFPFLSFYPSPHSTNFYTWISQTKGREANLMGFPTPKMKMLSGIQHLKRT